MMLGVLCALLVLTAVAGVTAPWWRANRSAPPERRRANVAAYKGRLAELEQEHAAGSLDAEATGELRSELQARLLAEAQAEETPPLRPARRWPIGLIAVSLPVFAGLWYWQAGTWRTQELVAGGPARQPGGAATSIEAMVGNLEARLQADPGNADGWVLLARSYYVLQRYADAADAYARANALVQPAQADLLVLEGEALALARDRDLSGKPRALFEQALALDAAHSRALWFAGLAAVQAEDYEPARRHWERLLAQELPGDLREDLRLRVAELAKLAPGAGRESTDSPPPTTPAELRLRLTVSVAPAMAAKFKPQDTLFVYASAAGGPPMPLAVQKLKATGFPLQVTLDDSMGMMPSLKLSQFERWIVTARVSPSGQAQPQPGDLQGEITLARAEADRPHELLINTALP